MISVQEASALIFSQQYKPIASPCQLVDSVGKVLAETVLADRDFPAFDRVTMDGIALSFNAWREGLRTFTIESTQPAGKPRGKLATNSNAIEVMTGAVLPEGTDTVVRYEDLKIESGAARVLADVVQGQHVHRQGQDARKDEVLLSPATILSPAEVALLASVGRKSVVIYDYPATAIVSGGDELVDVGDVPAPHQVRRSNSWALEAAMRTMGWPGTQFHFRDDQAELRDSIANLMKRYPVIILSGGVSKGKFDFIPSVMEALGVRKVFHEVAQRPGKPFWFGVAGTGNIVFALPGNPVSTFMCFYKYVRPWMLRSMGAPPRMQTATLARDFSFSPDLTYFLQVSIRNEAGRLMAYPDPGGGSGDFANLKNVDGFLELPPGKTTFKAGEAYEFIPFRQ